MTAKKKHQAPELPQMPNLAAFFSPKADPEPPAGQVASEPKEKPYTVTIKLPRSMQKPLKMRLAADEKELQDIGEAAFRAYLRDGKIPE